MRASGGGLDAGRSRLLGEPDVTRADAARWAELSIVYDRDVNGTRDRASEIVRFDRHGRVVHGEVHYGLVPA